jgi:hypothetical protein
MMGAAFATSAGGMQMSNGMKIAVAIVLGVAGVGFLVLASAATFGELGADLATLRWPFFAIGGVCIGLAVVSLATISKRKGAPWTLDDSVNWLEAKVQQRPLLRLLSYLIEARLWIILAVFFFFLGFGIIFAPELRTNPNKFTLTDAVEGVVAILGGFAMLLFVWIGWRRRC